MLRFPVRSTPTSNADFTTLKQRFILVSASLLLAGCAATGSQFASMDLDGNGVISRGEFTDAVAAASFAVYDRNNDGVIDLEEWRAVEKTSANDGLFRLRDLSRNGKISRQEARLAAEKNGSLAALFAAIDTNHDGVIDRNEARAYQAKLRTQQH
jgi:Ca2+-binding EF-hand superfamily protein